jgi:NAD(P)-dependent dehydrogenase (short-subunit alcohol dehydrogenase family)
MMERRFERKVAFITGGGSGIGAAVAGRFVSEGGSVGIIDRNVDQAAELANSIGPNALAVTADISKEEEVQRAVSEVVGKFGRVDVTVNCAGVGSGVTPIQEVSAERWHRTLATNLDGTFFSIKHTARAMIEQKSGGAIVNITSILAGQASPGIFYGVSKAAVDMLTKISALDLMEHGIRVVAVGPGLTDTPMNHAAITSVPATLASFMENIPAGRMATVHELAAAILFLASDEAAYITGTTLYVDGGILLRAYPKRPRTM